MSTANTHFTASASLEPTDDPLAFAGTPARMMSRRTEVALATYELCQLAREAGWTIDSDTSHSSGCSRYIGLNLGKRIKITLRVSDHPPGRPLGIEGDRAFLLAFVGLAGGLSHARRWLTNTAADVHRVRRGKRHTPRLRTADHQAA